MRVRNNKSVNRPCVLTCVFFFYSRRAPTDGIVSSGFGEKSQVYNGNLTEKIEITLANNYFEGWNHTKAENGTPCHPLLKGMGLRACLVCDFKWSYQNFGIVKTQVIPKSGKKIEFGS